MKKKICEYGNIKKLSSILGLSQRQVERFLQSGLIRREPDGRINITEAVRAYYRKKHTATDADYQYEKAMHIRTKRMLLEIKLLKLERQIVYKRDMEIAWGAVLSNARASLTALPYRLAPELVGTTREENFEILRREIYSTLNEMANADINADIERIEKEFDGVKI